MSYIQQANIAVQEQYSAAMDKAEEMREIILSIRGEYSADEIEIAAIEFEKLVKECEQFRQILKAFGK